MADEITEYTVRDYSAVDKQIDEIARRERILTNRLNLENLKRFINDFQHRKDYIDFIISQNKELFNKKFKYKIFFDNIREKINEQRI